MIVKIHDAKSNLSSLIKRVEEGEEVLIARDTVVVARLVPVAPAPKREFGALKGLVSLDAAFFEPLPDDEQRAWEA